MKSKVYTFIEVCRVQLHLNRFLNHRISIEIDMDHNTVTIASIWYAVSVVLFISIILFVCLLSQLSQHLLFSSNRQFSYNFFSFQNTVKFLSKHYDRIVSDCYRKNTHLFPKRNKQNRNFQ